MQVTIQSPHITLDEKLRELIQHKFEHLGRFYNRVNHCNVILRKEKKNTQNSYLLSASMELPKKVIFGEESASSFEIALDKVVVDLEHQLRRHKQKLDEKRKPDLL